MKASEWEKTIETICAADRQIFGGIIADLTECEKARDMNMEDIETMMKAAHEAGERLAAMEKERDDMKDFFDMFPLALESRCREAEASLAQLLGEGGPERFHELLEKEASLARIREGLQTMVDLVDSAHEDGVIIHVPDRVRDALECSRGS